LAVPTTVAIAGTLKNTSKGMGNTTNSITRSEHAQIRAAQGRNVNTTINDVQRARRADVLIQDDGRWVVRGQNGRVHILEKDGEIVTTMNKVTDANVKTRIRDGRWSRLTLEQEQQFSSGFSKYVKWDN